MIDVEALAGEIAFRLDPEALLDAEAEARAWNTERTAKLLPPTLVVL